MEAETPVKRTIMCDMCSEFKAKHKCEECGKMLCIKCKTNFTRCLHISSRQSVCETCRDNLIQMDRNTCCSII